MDLHASTSSVGTRVKVLVGDGEVVDIDISKIKETREGEIALQACAQHSSERILRTSRERAKRGVAQMLLTRLLANLLENLLEKLLARFLARVLRQGCRGVAFSCQLVWRLRSVGCANV